ncbi:LysE family translocator [Zobellella sp. DQSA1]|uniref:LysE family translocator n=1 Tax=Zobellella sp. DQSA1 TaxID=3342386 RepID=UPI0035C0FDA7
MDNYIIYVGVAMATILLPGPAVMLTINNSIQRGLSKSLAGIFGIALAILLVAMVSATSLGIILASSVMAFTVVKVIGAVYLIYLGIKMWRVNEVGGARYDHQEVSFFKCFSEGFLVSASNPKAVVFFMSIFPQFINLSQEYKPQFILLSLTFSMLVIIIHVAYALFSSFARKKLSSKKGNMILNKISGGVFVGFGVGLAASSR